MTKNPPIPEALKRVTVTEDPAQEELHSIRVDPTSGGDVAYLTVNPGLLPEGGLDALRVKAAVQAALEPFRRYNRRITDQYGTVHRDQKLFEQAEAQAAEEFEQLIQLAPRGEPLKKGGEKGASKPGAEPGGA